MNQPILLLCCAVLSSAFLTTSCERKTVVLSESVPQSWLPVEEVLQAQIKAMNREDLTAFMSYLHPDNPSYDTTSSTTRKLFEDYELKSGLEKIEPVSLTEGEAKVKFVQVTRKISGPAFRDNRVTGVHTLRKDGGIWKIFSTEATAVVYLDEPL